MKNRYNLTFTLLTLVIILFNSGCKEDGSNPVTPDTPRDVFEGSGTVGTKGAIVQITNQNSPLKGAYVDIPEGALSGNVTISISPAPSNIKYQEDSTALIIQFEPKGITFTKPIEIGIPYNNSVNNTDQIKAFYFDSDSNLLHQIPITSKNITNKVVTITTNHFSQFLIDDDGTVGTVNMYYDGKISVNVYLDGYYNGVNYGLAGIPTNLLLALQGIYNAKILVDHASYLFYGEDPSLIIQVELKKKVNYWFDDVLETKRLLFQRKKDNSGNHGGGLFIKRNNILEKIYNIPNQNSNEREMWFCGDPLIFNFDTPPQAGVNYYVDIKWVITHGVTFDIIVSAAATKIYKFSNYESSLKTSMMIQSDPDADNNFVMDSYQNQAPNEPSNPSPSHNATDQSVNVDISWQCSDPENDPLIYDIYFGTATNPTLVKSNHTSNSYDPGTLNYNTPYYWKIVAKDDHSNSKTGPIWKFTTPAGPVTPVLTTSSIINITHNSATGGGNISSAGSSLVTARGVCWSTSQNPTISDSKTSDGTGTGSFTSLLTNLYSGTTYYVRAYATNGTGTGYGDQVVFTTEIPQPPVISTSSITNITHNSAAGGGNVTWQGSSLVTARGVCWSTTQYPTINNDKTSDGTGTGNFISSLTGLFPLTTYYVRAYATNNSGTAYGDQVSFTTIASGTLPDPPTLSSPPDNATNISISPTLIWNPSANATSYRLQVSKNLQFTDIVFDESNITSLSKQISELNYNRTYLWRVNATNAHGTSNWSSLTGWNFTTKIALNVPCPGLPSIIDPRDGKVYETVQISSQCWLKKNINIGSRIDGNQDQTDNGTIEKYCYDNLESNCDEYGGLYQWNELMQYVTTQGSQGICPSGWHVPTRDEMQTLKSLVGGDGNKLKRQDQGIGAGQGTNESGFSALLSGERTNSPGYTFGWLDNYALIWSSSQYSPTYFAHLILVLPFDNNNIYVDTSYGNDSFGLSVRCLKD